MRIYGKISGFRPSERIAIKAPNLRLAFRKLASKNKTYISFVLKRTLPKAGRKLVLKTSLRELKKLESLAKKGVLSVNGINWLDRYLQAFYGSCEGAGISRAEGAFLQSEASVGCQSLLVQDKKTGVVRLIHTEEDSDPIGGAKFQYPYKVVSVGLTDKDITFFCYPDIFGWGYSIGVNEGMGFVQVVDDLMPKEEYNKGYFWSTAVSFMTLDSGSLLVAKEIIRKIGQIRGLAFNGGYALHMAQLNGKPKLASFEFIHKEVKSVQPLYTRDRSIIGQGNCAVTKGFAKYCQAGYPKRSDKWSVSVANLFVEMENRAKRLQRLGKEAKWLEKDAKNSITYGLKLLADPRGDVGFYKITRKKEGYFMTGLPSVWTYAHFVAYLGVDKAEYFLGKGLPKPVKGREYSLKYFKDYKFAEKKIWEEGQKVYKKFSKSRAIIP